ncbi:ATP-binding cassette domain-containing protein [Aquirufa novilacunae]|jgi:ABC-type multidrug transport system ATPase subunit|uniref:ABC transporter ATP-binding protein n=1 Tax=Aquirufa novilacunae TaxID=3139305 RepID=A0ABW8TYN2_9BACT
MLTIGIKKHQVTSHFALSNIQIKVKSGEIYALIGKSGSGKSTIAKLLVGLSIDSEYSIKINSKELNDGLDRLIPQFKQAGYVPQTLHLKPHHTVYNYAQVLFQYLPNNQQDTIITKYLKQFYLIKQKDTKVASLSGGERQKLALLEAISQPISYLVLDEPFSQLDTEQKLEFSQIIASVVAERAIPCVLISHDLTDILQLSQSVGIMEKGKLVFQGSWDKFKNSPNAVVIRLKQAILSWDDQMKGLINNLR